MGKHIFRKGNVLPQRWGSYLIKYYARLCDKKFPMKSAHNMVVITMLISGHTLFSGMVELRTGTKA